VAVGVALHDVGLAQRAEQRAGRSIVGRGSLPRVGELGGRDLLQETTGE
jgi:hypothetical protein